ncbi:hypothetical protein HMPREF0653_00944 [Prevotella disiens JCM 6334 = ATCC 29426]|uniref:Uncharacterized protein n=1 Tax=Prevotella disiens JCM 6334 = ATCC 29426 TaxID=1235811 RepID=A0ABP2Y8B2_9BACT|nr:hypothetical protein HMPREF0653_00944 [Prevotella disiens JCM 6334 = ATCC 29426]
MYSARIHLFFCFIPTTFDVKAILLFELQKYSINKTNISFLLDLYQ